MRRKRSKIHNTRNAFFFQKEEEKSQTKEDPNGSSSDQFTQFSRARSLNSTMTFGSHITRAMCVDFSYAMMFACASLFGAFFQRGGRIARAQEVFDGVTSPPSDASSSFAFEDDYLSSSMSFEGRTRQTMANPAQIGEAALSVLAANPTYEEMF